MARPIQGTESEKTCAQALCMSLSSLSVGLMSFQYDRLAVSPRASQACCRTRISSFCGCFRGPAVAFVFAEVEDR